ncbi:hypothetical protein H257_02302 [Aphanomyces astaci]|uniref:Uncharacterized protein n=1 Tax=Aphanomyces astaci TaxID=112090 RepID=W4H1C5_APHAT|nr:hypothetical protein H257_02302 [Aphanomyces astaci]ETV85697.1 hypothetical protein H257_02302 [Aphanomyces astaci]|eukprot:XP_009824169.1 hypothetical protein H257_02302 [Aphanomyces astaci]
MNNAATVLVGSIWDDDITVRIYVMSCVPNIRTILDCLVEIERICPLDLFEVLEEAFANPRGGPEWDGLELASVAKVWDH